MIFSPIVVNREVGELGLGLGLFALGLYRLKMIAIIYDPRLHKRSILFPIIVRIKEVLNQLKL